MMTRFLVAAALTIVLLLSVVAYLLYDISSRKTQARAAYEEEFASIHPRNDSLGRALTTALDDFQRSYLVAFRSDSIPQLKAVQDQFIALTQVASRLETNLAALSAYEKELQRDFRLSDSIATPQQRALLNQLRSSLTRYHGERATLELRLQEVSSRITTLTQEAERKRIAAAEAREAARQQARAREERAQRAPTPVIVQRRPTPVVILSTGYPLRWHYPPYYPPYRPFGCPPQRSPSVGISVGVAF